MKKFGILFAGALAFLAVAACDEKEETKLDDQNTTYDDSYYAAQATVTSSDANFTANGNGGSVNFKAEGGSVTLNVSCGCEWLAENPASDLFTTGMTSSSLTITAGQNTVEEDLTGTITLMTANQRITFATITVNQAAYGAPTITVETAEWNAPANGALTTEIAVEASADWTAESADSWLTVTKTESGITLTATENGETTERNTKVTLTCTDGIKSAYEYVTVNQDAKAYITLSSGTLSFGSSAQSSSVTVNSNYDWDFSYDSSNGWFSVTRSGNALTVSVNAYADTEVREGEIALTAGDGAENVAETQLTIAQKGPSEDDMIFTYNIISAGASTKLPLYGTVNCTVDWGDGKVETITSSNPSHTYSARGDYDIIISGTVTALNSNNISSSSSPLPLTAVKQWGLTGLNDMQYAFYYCTKLNALPEYTGDAFIGVTSFKNAFRHCSVLKAVPSKLFGNCPEATDFSYCFAGCSTLNTIAADAFNCPKATNMSYLFYDCSKLAEIPTGLFDNCPEVTSFSAVFNLDYNLKTLPKGLFDNCPKVTTFSYSFDHTAITVVPDGLFANCSEAESFQCAFYGCGSLRTIPADMFANCLKAKNFYATFYQCTSLAGIPSGLFDGCPEATRFYSTFYETAVSSIPEGLFDKNTKAWDFDATFYNCTNITEIPAGLFDNCPEATDFAFVFRGCTGITSIPENLFANNPEVTTFQTAFYQLSITEIPTDIFANQKKVTKFAYAFDGCSKITSGESPYDVIDGVKVHLYERANYPDVYSTPTSYNYCFTDCTGLSDYSSIPSDWGGGASTSSISSKSSSDTETSVIIPAITPKHMEL